MHTLTTLAHAASRRLRYSWIYTHTHTHTRVSWIFLMRRCRLHPLPLTAIVYAALISPLMRPGYSHGALIWYVSGESWELFPRHAKGESSYASGTIPPDDKNEHAWLRTSVSIPWSNARIRFLSFRYFSFPSFFSLSILPAISKRKDGWKEFNLLLDATCNRKWK